MAEVERDPFGPRGRGGKTQQFSGDAERKLLQLLSQAVFLFFIPELSVNL